MNLINTSRMLGGYTMGMEPSGRESMVVVAKATFIIPPPGVDPTLAQVQIPIIEADTCTGEQGLTAPVYESDYSPQKKHCDVIVNGSAYAPGGKPVKQVLVGLKVANAIEKKFRVLGNREWEAGLLSTQPSDAAEFTVMPVGYDTAFGGLDNRSKNPDKHLAWMQNPVGRGYHNDTAAEYVNTAPMPNTEEVDTPVTDPRGRYKPMAFGPLGRGWEPRSQWAGTYDDEWFEQNFPFLPHDFDSAYYQCAPQDQQMPFVQGGEEVVLVNLTPEGFTRFNLPCWDIPVVFFRKKQDDVHTKIVYDTLVIEPDKGVFSLTGRASIPLKKDMFEISEILLGTRSSAWWRARKLGKTYYPSLASVANNTAEVD